MLDLDLRRGHEGAICHGGVIGVLVSHLTGGTERWAFGNPPFASCSRITINEEGRSQVVSLNEIGHFDAMRKKAIGPDGEGFADRMAMPSESQNEA